MALWSAVLLAGPPCREYLLGAAFSLIALIGLLAQASALLFRCHPQSEGRREVELTVSAYQSFTLLLRCLESMAPSAWGRK